MSLRKQLFSSCLGVCLLFFPLVSSAAEFFDAQQKQSIGQYFKLTEIIKLSDGAANKGVITLGKDHRKGDYFLKLQYSKAVQIDGKKKIQLFTIGHYANHQALSPGAGCRSPKQQAIPFKHPQLGDFIICARSNGASKKEVSATVWPGVNNPYPQLEIEYTGTVSDLVILLKALQVYS